LFITLKYEIKEKSVSKNVAKNMFLEEKNGEKYQPDVNANVFPAVRAH
jgi:hypothetical protein